MRRLIVFSLLTLAVAGVACYPIEQPLGGVASISPLLAPWPAVVAGDSMRDSAGHVAPLRVLAYGTGGDTLPSSATFVVLDSGAHLAGNVLVGDLIRTSPVRVAGTVGGLQTPFQNIFITAQPTTLGATTKLSADGRTDTLVLVPDTSWTANNSNVQLRVSGGFADTASVGGWLVFPRIVHAPASRDTAPTAYVLGTGATRTGQDTTGATGSATVRVLIRAGALADSALLVGTRADDVVVVVEASYKGVPLKGSPLQYVIPVKFKGISTP